MVCMWDGISLLIKKYDRSYNKGSLFFSKYPPLNKIFPFFFPNFMVKFNSHMRYICLMYVIPFRAFDVIFSSIPMRLSWIRESRSVSAFTKITSTELPNLNNKRGSFFKWICNGSLVERETWGHANIGDLVRLSPYECSYQVINITNLSIIRMKFNCCHSFHESCRACTNLHSNNKDDMNKQD